MERGGKLVSGSINIFNIVRTALLLIIVVTIIIVFIGLPLFVSGQSMEPNFRSGQLVFVEKLSFSGKKSINRFDIVAAKFPADPENTRLIKRVVGLPGETVEIKAGLISVDGEPLQEPYEITIGTPPYSEIARTVLGQGEYFLVGDNRPGSSDSRLWGAVQRSDIQGKVWAILWPLGDARVIVQDYF